MFHLTHEAINEILHFHNTKPLTPLSIHDLITKGGKLSSDQIAKVNQLFIQPQYQSMTTALPIAYPYLNELGKMMVDLISYILGYGTYEDVDETIMAMLSIFSPRMPPTVHYDFAIFIANKIHEKLMNLEREKVFKYIRYIYHLFLFYQPDAFPVPVKKLDA